MLVALGAIWGAVISFVICLWIAVRYTDQLRADLNRLESRINEATNRSDTATLDRMDAVVLREVARLIREDKALHATKH